MSAFVIKMIACFTMILDHIKYAIPATNNFATMYLGRISFPLFAFLVVEGYIHTSNLNKYCKRLLIFALISQIPFMLFRSLVGEYLMLNIMFTMLLGIASIMAYDKIENKILSLVICLILIILGSVVNVDYGWFGVAVILILYIFRENNIQKSIAYTLLVLLYFYTLGLNFNNIIVLKLIMACLIPIIPICLYNGKQGKKIKYFFYWFYPIHMLVLYGLSFIFL